MRNPYLTDELTTKMHEELQVHDDVDKVHRVSTIKKVIKMGLMTRAQALYAYGLSDEDLTKDFG